MEPSQQNGSLPKILTWRKRVQSGEATGGKLWLRFYGRGAGGSTGSVYKSVRCLRRAARQSRLRRAACRRSWRWSSTPRPPRASNCLTLVAVELWRPAHVHTSGLLAPCPRRNGHGSASFEFGQAGERRQHHATTPNTDPWGTSGVTDYSITSGSSTATYASFSTPVAAAIRLTKRALKRRGKVTATILQAGIG
jgi:hypothetical protein